MRMVLVLALIALGSPSLLADTRFPAPSGQAVRTLSIHAATDLVAVAPLIEGFQRRYPDIEVNYREFRTHQLFDSMKEICTGRGAPPDLVMSSAVDEQVKLVNDGCAQSYASTSVEALPDWARWRNEIFGLTFEPVVMVYNKDALPEELVPRTRFDLVDLLRTNAGDLYGRVATYNIEQSGVGYLLAFEDSRQASTYGRLVESFGRTAVVALCCTLDILEGVSEGRYVIGYNVLGSYTLAWARKDPRVGIILPRDYTLVITRAAFIPVGAPGAEAARLFLDFALSEEGRRILIDDSLLFSPMMVDETVRAVEGSASVDEQSLRPIALSPELMVGLDRAKQEVFLQQWRDSVRSVDELGVE